MKIARHVCFGALLVAPLAIPAQEGRIGLSLRAGATFPSDRATRSAFGDTWLSIGISPARVEVRDGWGIDSDLAVSTREQGSNRFLAIRYTTGPILTFGEAEEPVRPFVAARAGIAYFDYRIVDAPDRVSAKRGAPTLNVEAGVILDRRAQLSVRYDLYPRYDGFRFDGLTIGFTWEIVRF